MSSRGASTYADMHNGATRQRKLGNNAALRPPLALYVSVQKQSLNPDHQPSRESTQRQESMWVLFMPQPHSAICAAAAAVQLHTNALDRLATTRHSTTPLHSPRVPVECNSHKTSSIAVSVLPHASQGNRASELVTTLNDSQHSLLNGSQL
jgi:hypothetical protein